MIRKIANKLGVDKAIFFSSITRIVAGLGGAITVIFIAKYLTGIEQGFYYTFGSILAIQVFFELGITGIITQFVAHEVSHLKIENGYFVGHQKYLSRLTSLLRLSIKWFSYISIGLLILLIIVGFIFFKRYYHAPVIVNWHVPWILLSIGTVFNFMVAPLLSFVEGLGKVKEVAKIRMIQQIFVISVTWLSLIAGFKLYTPAIVSIMSPFILLVFILFKEHKILKKIYYFSITEKVNYKTEIFPYQWKISLSWIGGYFIFQLFNPIVFATSGPVAAGQMGLSITVINSIQALALSWITTKVPKFSSFIAHKDYINLDKLFNITLKQIVLIAIGAFGLMYTGLYVINIFQIHIGGVLLVHRFLPFLPMALMMFCSFLSQINYSWATYLRCHKKEPLLLSSLIMGAVTTSSIFIFGKYYGLLGITISYTLLTIILTIWIYLIYKNKRLIWHYE